MPGRTIAIGDIHGCTLALEAVLDAIAPRPDDVIITLGDYVDRGADVPGTIERLIRLGEQCRLMPLLGNHDEMLLDIRSGKSWLMPDWLRFGGAATLAGYQVDHPDDIPQSHIDFLKSCHSWYETDLGAFFAWPASVSAASDLLCCCCDRGHGHCNVPAIARL